jgi:hypothetical protein
VPLNPDASEPLLHCNGNKLAGRSFPNGYLPIVRSMIATGILRNWVSSSQVGFAKTYGSKIVSPSARYSLFLRFREEIPADA